MNSFVQVIRADGTPGQLYGPFEYADAEQVLRSALILGKNDNGPVAITPEIEEAINDSGFWTFEGGGGIYIVQSEEFSTEDFNLGLNVGYSVEDDQLFHSMYPEDSLGDFQDGRFVPSRFLLELPPDCHRLADEYATQHIGEQLDVAEDAEEEDRRDHKRGLYGDGQ